MNDGEGWKQSANAPTSSELRQHAKAGTLLLLELAWTRGPIEAKIGLVSPNGEYFTIEVPKPEVPSRIAYSGRRGTEWFARRHSKIADILSAVKRYHNSPGHGEPLLPDQVGI